MRAEILLRKLTLIVGTIAATDALQNCGLTKDEALIALRAATFILEEMPDAAPMEASKAQQLTPELEAFFEREIAELIVKEKARDRKHEGS